MHGGTPHPSASSRPVPANYVCKICEKPGHWIERCPEKGDPSLGGPPPLGYVCKICRQPGHWIQRCPKKDREQQQTVPPPRGYVCNKCHEPGHWIGKCPMGGGGPLRR